MKGTRGHFSHIWRKGKKSKSVKTARAFQPLLQPVMKTDWGAILKKAAFSAKQEHIKLPMTPKTDKDMDIERLSSRFIFQRLLCWAQKSPREV